MVTENRELLNLGPMQLTVEEVTPDIATEWLTNNNKCNRPLNLKTAEQYARDQTTGKWYEKPLAICFDENGNLVNGQHSLKAITLSGMPQRCLLARNVPRETVAILDRGRIRSLSDVAHFFDISLSNRAFQTARVLDYGIRDRGARSFHEYMEAVMHHEEALKWVMERAPADRAFSATLLSVVAAAWYTKDRTRLAEFLRILHDGQGNGQEDSGAILLRDFVRKPKQKLKGGRGALETRVVNALTAFLERRSLKVLQPHKKGRAIDALTRSDIFPLPADELASSAAAGEVDELVSSALPEQGDELASSAGSPPPEPPPDALNHDAQ